MPVGRQIQVFLIGKTFRWSLAFVNLSIALCGVKKFKRYAEQLVHYGEMRRIFSHGESQAPMNTGDRGGLETCNDRLLSDRRSLKIPR